MIARLPVAAVLLVAVCSGTLAAVATHDVAIQTGAVSHPTLGWLLPVILEGAAVVAAVLAFQRARAGLRAWPERCALAALIVVATVVNAAHASGHSLLGQLLAAMPPIILLGATELLLRNSTQQVTPGYATVSPPNDVAADVAADVEARESPQDAPGRLESPVGLPVPIYPPTCPAEPTTTTVPPATARHALVARWLADGERLSGAVVAERLACSPATGRRLLAAVREHIASESSIVSEAR